MLHRPIPASAGRSGQGMLASVTVTVVEAVEPLDDDSCWRAVTSRDRRFDGRFVTAVRTTGIFCRPSCPAQTPRREHVRFYRCAAAAVAAGFRACKRCRPDAAPGSRDWDVRADLAARALRAIAAGVVDEVGVPGLARRLHVSERQLHRVLVAEVGVGPLALARTRRAQAARLLLSATDLPATRIAHAAGFGSVRQFNDTIREHFGCPPAALRRPGPAVPATGTLTVRVAHRAPYDVPATLRWLARHAISGVETVDDEGYRRVLPDGTRITLRPATDSWTLTVPVEDVSRLAGIVATARRILDSDADPAAVGATLGADPLLAPLVARRPGLRVPGAADPFELAVATVVGQQVSRASAATMLARLVTRYGEPLPAPEDGLTHRFPTADALAAADLTGLTAARATTVRSLATAVAAGRVPLDPATDRREAVAALRALPGIGPWTVAVVALRGLGDPDAWPGSDLVLRRRLAGTGAVPDRWRPWRGYAAMHLWNGGS